MRQTGLVLQILGGPSAWRPHPGATGRRMRSGTSLASCQPHGCLVGHDRRGIDPNKGRGKTVFFPLFRGVGFLCGCLAHLLVGGAPGVGDKDGVSLLWNIAGSFATGMAGLGSESLPFLFFCFLVFIYLPSQSLSFLLLARRLVQRCRLISSGSASRSTTPRL